MNFVRAPRFLAKSRCNILNNYRSTAKICTTITVRKPELETEEKPYPFISKLKEGKFEVEEISEEEVKKYTRNYPIKMGLLVCVGLSFISYVLLRKPSEIDEALERMLKVPVAGFEEYELLVAIDKAKQSSLDTTALEAKLVEVTKKLNKEKEKN